MKLTILTLSLLLAFPLQAQNKFDSFSPSDEFKAFWYQGKAEISRYTLNQARYGEIHKGHAVLIFVTEDFLTDKQVKREFPSSEPYTSVLKLNMTRKFNTGIYPYSTMTSVFTPIELARHPRTIKVSATSQEWCGHTFMQLNLRDNEYIGKLFSYFQSRGDREILTSADLLEDEIWTRIRISYETLPQGEITLVPGLFADRLRKIGLEPQKAIVALEHRDDPAFPEKELMAYTVEYNDIERRLEILFARDFPHEIVVWEETVSSGSGSDAKTLTTRAVKTHSLFTDYWNKHSVSDSTYRIHLGLQP